MKKVITCSNKSTVPLRLTVYKSWCRQNIGKKSPFKWSNSCEKLKNYADLAAHSKKSYLLKGQSQKKLEEGPQKVSPKVREVVKSC